MKYCVEDHYASFIGEIAVIAVHTYLIRDCIRITGFAAVTHVRNKTKFHNWLSSLNWSAQFVFGL